MSVDAFEKTNFGWQMQQQLRQLGEWVELKLSQITPPKLPDVPEPTWLKGLFHALQLLGSVLFSKVTFWLILGLLLTWIIWQAWQLWKHQLIAFPSLIQKSGASSTTPQASELSVSTWLRRSQEFYRQGNYGEACRSLYMAALQKLHEAGIAPHHPSRTDGEYRQLTQELPQEDSYRTLLTTHERLYFGSAEISPDDFAQCQQAYQQIQSGEGTATNPGEPKRRHRRQR